LFSFYINFHRKLAFFFQGTCRLTIFDTPNQTGGTGSSLQLLSRMRGMRGFRSAPGATFTAKKKTPAEPPMLKQCEGAEAFPT
jgi:hypothetical protein